MEQESERVNVQLREWQKSREETSEDFITSRQAVVMVQFINEFEDHIMKRLTGVDSAYARLQYVRKQCKLQGLMAKSYLLGTSHFYINLQGSYWSITGREQRNIGEMLVPMLKHLIEIMEENKTCVLPPDTQAPVSGYSSRSTLKASAANSDNLQVSPSAVEKCKPVTNLPWCHSPDIYHRHQGYVLQFLMEKQASELIHLEHILLTEEISQIWNFYESYKVKVNILSLIPKEKMAQLHGKKDQELNQNVHWDKLILELSDVHRTALKVLHEKHREEVKSMGLNPDVVIPTSYFHRDVKESILQLALEMQSVYHQVSHDSAQGVSSAEAKSVINDKDSQHLLFHTLAAKLVRQELLLQIHMYNILDAYSKIQTDNCVPEIKKALCKMNLRPSYGKSAAEEAAKRMEKQHIEKIIIFLKKSFKDQQNQMSLNEMQTQLKEEHSALTEQLLQEENTIWLQDMSMCPDTKSHIDHAVCFVLSQRHFRQAVVLLQDIFKAQQRNEHDNSVVAGQEEILNLFNNKTEAKLLLTDLQQVIKRIRLRERHLGEIAGSLKEFCSDKVHILSCVEEAHYLEYELQAFVKQQLQSLKEELEECSQLERQSVVEEKKSLKGLQEKQAEIEQAHRKQISEENLKLQDQLERGELNGWMKQKLIREHDETIAFLEKNLQQDLEKLNVKLEEELRIKERLVNVDRRHQNLETDTPTTGKMNLPNNDQKILSLMTDHINIFHQTEQIAAARTTFLGPYLFSSLLPPDGNDCKIVESSLLLTLLKEVDDQLRASAQSAKLLQSDKNLGLKNTFRDIQDLQSNCKGDLSVIDPKELSARELVTYEYGTDILESLKLHIKTGNLHLHITSYIPHNNYNGNAFSHSFFYQSTENIVFVSREYLQSVGSLILLVVHCFAHFAVGDFNDDSNPLFLRMFYQALKVCLSEGFLPRLQLQSSQLQCNKIKCVEGGDQPPSKMIRKEMTEQLSTLISPRLDVLMDYRKPLKTFEEIISGNEVEAILKTKLAAWKLQFFASCEPQICVPEKGEDKEWSTAEHLQDKLDELNTELALILKKEVELRRNVMHVDGPSYQLQMVLAEKDCLINRIVKMEEKAPILSSMV